jgi:hypothetical protein
MKRASTSATALVLPIAALCRPSLGARRSKVVVRVVTGVPAMPCC